MTLKKNIYSLYYNEISKLFSLYQTSCVNITKKSFCIILRIVEYSLKILAVTWNPAWTGTIPYKMKSETFF